LMNNEMDDGIDEISTYIQKWLWCHVCQFDSSLKAKC
jgi:hypothetical protein